MKERPILFSGEMVRAILEGRKTQTRRLVVPRTWDACAYSNAYLRHHEDPRIGLQAYFWNDGMEDRLGVRCPYADGIGDRLWIRETWAPMDTPDTTRPRRGIGSRANQMDGKVYRADECTGSPFLETTEWRPSIHMPRWASRITLEVTEVRLQRLQEISESDACAEGMGSPITRDCKRPKFVRLWDELSGRRAPWDSNPWVWAISFKRVAP